MFIITCVPSVSGDLVSPWRNVFIHSALLHRLLFWNPTPEPIHVPHRLNILNGSVVVQLLDSWTNTSSSIKLVTDTLLQGCALLPQSKKTHKVLEDFHLQQENFHKLGGRNIQKYWTYFIKTSSFMVYTSLRNWKETCNEFAVHDSDPEKVNIWLWDQVTVRKSRAVLRIYIVAHPSYSCLHKTRRGSQSQRHKHSAATDTNKLQMFVANRVQLIKTTASSLWANKKPQQRIMCHSPLF